MKENKSSKEFFIQRWWSCFSLYLGLNNWLGADKLERFLTIKNFPCLNKLKVKDTAQDRIRITIEILEEDASIRKCGPAHKGKYFRRKKKEMKGKYRRMTGQVIRITDEGLTELANEDCIGCKERRRQSCRNGDRALYCLNRGKIIWSGGQFCEKGRGE